MDYYYLYMNICMYVRILVVYLELFKQNYP